jgi:hypothetical protein
MKNLTITVLSLFIGATSYAQDNTLPPTGNVGIGTLTPSAKLDVNGNAIIDSCLIVKDTLFVQDDARIMKDMRVEGGTKLESLLVNGYLTAPNLIETNDFTEMSLLMVNSNGLIYKGGTYAPNPTTDDSCEPNGINRTNPKWLFLVKTNSIRIVQR